jgi:hypothetical protein
VAGSHGAEKYGTSVVTISPSRCDFEDGRPAVTMLVTDWNLAGDEPNSQTEVWLFAGEARRLALELLTVAEQLEAN